MTVVVVFPGASLLAKSVTSEGALKVRCPGCGSEKVFNGTTPDSFEHQGPCPVYRRIKKAQREYERDIVRKG